MRRGDNKWDTDGWQEGQPRAAHPGRESEELSPQKSLLCLSSQLQTREGNGEIELKRGFSITQNVSVNNRLWEALLSKSQIRGLTSSLLSL